MHSTRPLRIVLAEDGVLLQAGLTRLLSHVGHEVPAAVSDAEALITAVREHRPDLVITDVRMPPGFSDEGLRAAVALRAADPGLPVLVLSQYVEQTYAAELIDSADGRGVGYLLKDRIGDIEEFIAAIDRVAGGGTVVDPEVVRRLLRRRAPVSLLTAREQEVLALMAEGRSNIAIARALTITEASVAKHIRSIFVKLDLPPSDTDHRRVLAVLAYLRG
ncbi:response regulator transcription factor [Actinoallomurus spadix]|uniref:Response regulator transcription factor n=1 Tax=Actinoallomurus spadix TaxID=79912 RepID=A0ABP3G8B8_9ACTN|nr:response regulator transcription factor [Actinoallomurus spadix]MCO5990604.1 response regulator transcription factor [Actinoallomurus spadix]